LLVDISDSNLSRLLNLHSYKYQRQNNANVCEYVDRLADVDLWVKSSRSIQIEYYHLSGWYWGKADTRHS